MLTYLHRISAIFFYLLAGSFFLAYILLRRTLLTPLPEWWLQVLDLPLLLTGILYGGLSLYRSLRGDASASLALALTITLPLAAVFVFFVILTFLPMTSPEL